MLQLRFSPEGGSLVTVGQEEGTCSGLPPGHCIVTKVWDARTLELRRTFDVAPFDVAFSPDDSLLLMTLGDGEATVWDLADGSPLTTFRGNPGYLGAVSGSFDADGRRVVTARGDRAARVWDVASGRLLLTLSADEAMVQFATFSADGRLVLSTRSSGAAGGGVADLWDATTGALLRSFTAEGSRQDSSRRRPVSRLRAGRRARPRAVLNAVDRWTHVPG